MKWPEGLDRYSLGIPLAWLVLILVGAFGDNLTLDIGKRWMDATLNQLPGLLIGILGSLIAWWILFRLISPKLIFSERISRAKADDEPGDLAYRVRFENSGRRAIIDLSIKAILRIRGLNPLRPSNWETTYLPVSFEGDFPYVFPNREKGNRRIIRIRVKKKNEFERTVYPTEIREKARDRSLTLDDLLSIGTQATVQLIALGSDSFSGARKAFFSPGYTRNDIVSHPFWDTSPEVEGL
jgi:hypothetical protein